MAKRIFNGIDDTEFLSVKDLRDFLNEWIEDAEVGDYENAAVSLDIGGKLYVLTRVGFSCVSTTLFATVKEGNSYTLEMNRYNAARKAQNETRDNPPG